VLNKYNVTGNLNPNIWTEKDDVEILMEEKTKWKWRHRFIHAEKHLPLQEATFKLFIFLKKRYH
jgi:hypothetical protein